VKHACDAAGDARTLCGLAYEGECVDPDTDDPAPVVAEKGELITCPTCRQIIDHCKWFKQYRAT
jgi:hypothetical protein